MSYQLEKEQILTKVTFYWLQGKPEGTQIMVQETIAGSTSEGKFLAQPCLSMLYFGKPQYRGYGDSEEEALNNCLKMISGVPAVDLFTFGSGNPFSIDQRQT